MINSETRRRPHFAPARASCDIESHMKSALVCEQVGGSVSNRRHAVKVALAGIKPKKTCGRRAVLIASPQ